MEGKSFCSFGRHDKPSATSSAHITWKAEFGPWNRSSELAAVSLRHCPVTIPPVPQFHGTEASKSCPRHVGARDDGWTAGGQSDLTAVHLEV
jgi:hypothetical protein